MNKKNILIGIGLVCILVIILGIALLSKKEESIEKFYLTDKYYTEESGEFMKITPEELDGLKEENYILYTYNDYCRFPVSCESIFEEFMQEYKIHFLSIPFADFRNTSFYPDVKYAPTVIIIQKGKVIAYLDADSDDDVEKYQNKEKLKEWLEQYIYLSKE